MRWKGEGVGTPKDVVEECAGNPTYTRVGLENHGRPVRGKGIVGPFWRPGSTVIFRMRPRCGRAVARFEVAGAHGGCERLDVPKGTQSRRSAKGSLIKPHRAHAQ